MVPELHLPLVDQVISRGQLFPSGIMYMKLFTNSQKQYKCSVSIHYFYKAQIWKSSKGVPEPRVISWCSPQAR